MDCDVLYNHQTLHILLRNLNKGMQVTLRGHDTRVGRIAFRVTQKLLAILSLLIAIPFGIFMYPAFMSALLYIAQSSR